MSDANRYLLTNEGTFVQNLGGTVKFNLSPQKSLMTFLGAKGFLFLKI